MVLDMEREGQSGGGEGEALNQSYVLVKHPADDPLLQRSEGMEGDGVEVGLHSSPRLSIPRHSDSPYLHLRCAGLIALLCWKETRTLTPASAIAVLSVSAVRAVHSQKTMKPSLSSPLPTTSAATMTAPEAKLALGLEWDGETAFPRYNCREGDGGRRVSTLMKALPTPSMKGGHTGAFGGLLLPRSLRRRR